MRARYTTCKNFPTITWTADQFTKGIFCIDREFPAERRAEPATVRQGIYRQQLRLVIIA